MVHTHACQDLFSQPEKPKKGYCELSERHRESLGDRKGKNLRPS